jgi:hypothetical protein
MDAKERLEKIKAADDKLTKDYITLFKTPKVTQAQLVSARKAVLADFDAILKARIFLPDEKGHYDPVRAAIEDGGRRRVVDIIQRINRNFKEDDVKGKPKVTKK